MVRDPSRYFELSSSWYFLVIVPCVFAAALVILTSMTAGTQTLYPVGRDGNPDTSQAGTTATMGIGIYLADDSRGRGLHRRADAAEPGPKSDTGR